MIQRRLYNDIKNHLTAREISILVGPRQVGKTTLMQLLQKELQADGKQTLFLNMDYEPDSLHFISQNNLMTKLDLEFGGRHGYVFIDEIQRKENAGIFLKGIYDQNLPFKFIVSGSGSLELKEKIHESLAGRKRLFELFPVSFEEFIHYKTEYTYKHKLDRYLEIEKESCEQYLKEYLSFGGYPRIITEQRQNEKRLLMDEIFRSYVERDIVYLLKIDRTEAFTNLVKILSTQIGQIIRYSTLSAHLGISLQTLKKYLWYLEKTFIIKRITPFYTNYKKEIVKSPQFYFNDLGLRNFALGKFGYWGTLYDQGFLFQNFVFNILYEKLGQQSAVLHYWRTTDQTEVDMVIEGPDGLLPIEVKCINLKQRTVKRSLRSFIDRYGPSRAFVINLGLNDIMMIDETRVQFLPYYKLLDMNFQIP